MMTHLRLIAGSHIHFCSTACQMLDGRIANASATRQRVKLGMNSLRERTHFPPVTMITLPFNSGRSATGSKFVDKKLPIRSVNITEIFGPPAEYRLSTM